MIYVRSICCMVGVLRVLGGTEAPPPVD